MKTKKCYITKIDKSDLENYYHVAFHGAHNQYQIEGFTFC